jgi:hypothetical protein
MRQEIYNYTIRQHQTIEYHSSNPIKQVLTPDIFSDSNETFYANNTPWGSFRYKNTYNTEDVFKDNYSNPLCALSFERVIICVTTDEDKISFKIFQYSKRRRLAGKWFKVNTKCQFVTFNSKSNSLYTGSLINYHLKRKCGKNIRRCMFNLDPINKMRICLREILNGYLAKGIIEDVPEKINEIINSFVNAIPGTEKYLHMSPDMRIYKRYLDNSGIKFPNNWFELMIVFPQPKKKDLVKRDFKYIDAFMDVHNVNGDKLKRILHNVKSCNFETYNFACKLFGKNYITSQNDDIIKKMLENPVTGFYLDENMVLPNKEKGNSFEIFKLVINGEISSSTYRDHFRFYESLKRFDEPVKWKSNTHTDFIEEHFDWSEKHSHYHSGDFKRIYNNKFVQEVNNVILQPDDCYIPIVLQTTKDYNMESISQSNCVKTYIKTTHSLLISLRRSGIDSSDRASIEYRISHNGKKFNLHRVQTLGRYNKLLDNSWDKVLNVLDNRISNLVDDKLFDTLGIIAKVKGKEIHSDYKTTKGVGLHIVGTTPPIVYNLGWENDLIYKMNSNNSNWAVEIENNYNLFDF